MACELPVVTSTKSGAAELVLANDAGLVCPAGDVAGLAAQMRTLLDPTTRARLGANARRAVLPLSPSAITLRLVLLYRDLLAATVQAKAAGKAYRRAGTAADAPSTTTPASGSRAAPQHSAPKAAATPAPSTSAAPSASATPDTPPETPDAGAAPPDAPAR